MVQFTTKPSFKLDSLAVNKGDCLSSIHLGSIFSLGQCMRMFLGIFSSMYLLKALTVSLQQSGLAGFNLARPRRLLWE